MRKSITKSAVYILCFILIFLFLAFAYSLSAFAAGSDSIDSIDNVRLSGTLVTGFDVDVTYGGAAGNQIVIVWDGSEGILNYTGASVYCHDSKYAGETPYGGGANMNFALVARPDITGPEKTYFIGLYEKTGTVLVQRANTTIIVGNNKVIWNGVTLYTYVAPVDPANNNDRVETTFTFSESDWIDEQVLKIALASGTSDPNVTFDYSSIEYAVPNAVMKALIKYSDVSLTIITSYAGDSVSLYIPAGTAVDDEIPWYGPLYLKSRYELAGVSSNAAPAESVSDGTSSHTVYTIQAGDTLSKIAAANSTTVDILLSINSSITNPDLIYAGASLMLP